MKKLTIFLYGVVSYGAFLATFLYLAGFMSNLWVPKSIDCGPDGATWPGVAHQSVSARHFCGAA